VAPYGGKGGQWNRGGGERVRTPVTPVAPEETRDRKSCATWWNKGNGPSFSIHRKRSGEVRARKEKLAAAIEDRGQGSGTKKPSTTAREERKRKLSVCRLPAEDEGQGKTIPEDPSTR